MLSQTAIEPGSFRDRQGRIVYHDQGVYRLLSPAALAHWEAVSATRFFAEAVAAGEVIATQRVPPGTVDPSAVTGNWTAALHHELIPFISYPYEWSFGMLKDAALLHLGLIERALAEDMTLKDASAYNVQWRGTKPVFIDIASFQPYEAGDPWVGYRQFCQLFLFPLFLQAYKKHPFHALLRGNPDGIDPEDFSGLMSLRDLLRPGVLLHVWLQAKLQRSHSASARNVKQDLHSSGFGKALIEANVHKLKRLVAGLEWRTVRTQWSHYVNEHSYSDEGLERKKAFVREVVARRRWLRVWDLGSNTGTFARLAAENAEHVVAMDADHLAVEFMYQSLRKEGNSRVLPLVVNLANTSPNLGWRGQERKSLEARGRPDLTLALALIHHAVISANIPLEEFVTWLASLGSALVIEFVSKDDSMVQRLLRNKDDIYSDYTRENFEHRLGQSFRVVRQEPLPGGTRFLYYAEPA